MKLISWNVNGLRACIQKGFLDFFQKADADFFCLQETKLSEGQLNLSLPGYHQYWNYAEKKGYSGTAIFTKHKPVSVRYGIGVEELDNEGRVITLEYPEFFVVNCYTPNAQRGLARLDHRMKWDEAYRQYISSLDAQKPAILCGDLNVAHNDIDLKNPSSNRMNAGFSQEERKSFSKTLSLGFTDSFRYLHPDTTGAYTWWSYMYHARENNAGWRIDYFLTSDRIKEKIYSTPIYSDVLGSDHCPVGLELDIPCNGSIWHDASQGQPQVVSPSDKMKSTPAKVMLSILAVILLLGVGMFIAGRMPQSYQNYLTVHPFEHSLSLTICNNVNAKLYTYGITDGTTTWPINVKYNLTLSSISPIMLSDARNYWLRLDLTDRARKSFDPSWKLTVEPVPAQDQATLAVDCELSCHSYFTDDDPNHVMGWFIYGTIPGNTLLNITLDTGDREITFQLNAAPLNTDYDRGHAMKLATEPLVNKIVCDETIHSLLNDVLFNDQGEEIYQKAVAENGLLAELETRFDASEYLLKWFSSGNDMQKSTAYALLTQNIYKAGFTAEQQHTYLRLAESYTSISKQFANTYSTKELLLYLLNLHHFCNTLTGYYYPVDYAQLEKEFPALEVLSRREDLNAELLQIVCDDQMQKEVVHYLLYFHIDKMTPSQEAIYLLRQYPSSIFPGNPVSIVIPEENRSTEELIRALFLDSGLGAVLIRASNDDVREEIFFRATDNIPIVSQIIKREDFVDTLFSLADTNTISNYLMMLRAAMRLSFVQDNMNAEQRKIYEEKHTEFFDLILYGDSLAIPSEIYPVGH